MLVAWDPVTQKERWRNAGGGGIGGGTVTTAGNLVLQVIPDGRLLAYSADKGAKLWEAKVGTGIIASPVTYEVGGMQYVSIMAGWGGSFALSGGSLGLPATPGRLLTFALNGKQKLFEAVSVVTPEVSPIESSA